MGLLDDIMGADAEAFVDTDAFGESVTFIQNGETNTYSAVIERQGNDQLEESFNGVTPRYTVHLRYDSTGTVGPATIDEGGARIRFPRRWGEDAENNERRVQKVEHSDNGMWTLLVY